jgi:hypothetical protein
VEVAGDDVGFWHLGDKHRRMSAFGGKADKCARGENFRF